MAPGVVQCVLVAAGGSLGALCRFMADKLPVLAQTPYYRTMCINTIGCMLIGILATVLSQVNAGEGWYRIAITGFLGGFTTYSTFSLDAVKLMQQGQWPSAILYIALTVTCCIAACATGMWLSGRIIKTF